MSPEMWTTLAAPGGVFTLSAVAMYRGWIVPRWTMNLIRDTYKERLDEQKEINDLRRAENVELAGQVKELLGLVKGVSAALLALEQASRRSG